MATAQEAVINFFLERHIFLREDWLNSVLRFLRQKNVNFENTEALSHLVYEQWLHSDISETMDPSPSTIDPSARLGSLGGPLVLQIKSVLDVSSSFYSQVKACSRDFVDNSGFQALTENEKEAIQEARPQRTLTLLLTNGAADFKAFEFKPIQELSLLTKPGAKVLFLPPMRCRRGRYLLEFKNFQLLGGEVESYLETFHPVKVMRTAIGLGAKRNPRPPQEAPEPAPRTPLALIQPTARLIPTLRHDSTLRAEEVLLAEPRSSSRRSGFEAIDEQNRSHNQSLISSGRLLTNDDFDNEAAALIDEDSNDILNEVVIEESDSDEEITMRTRSRNAILNRTDYARESTAAPLPPPPPPPLATAKSTRGTTIGQVLATQKEPEFDFNFEDNFLETPPSVFLSPMARKSTEIPLDEDILRPHSLKRKSNNSSATRAISPPYFLSTMFQDDDFGLSSPKSKEKPKSLLGRALGEASQQMRTAAGPSSAHKAPAVTRNPFSANIIPKEELQRHQTQHQPQRNEPTPQKWEERGLRDAAQDTCSSVSNVGRRADEGAPVRGKEARISEPAPAPPSIFVPRPRATPPRPVKATTSQGKSAGIQGFFKPAPKPPVPAASTARCGGGGTLVKVKVEVIDISDDEEQDVKPDIAKLQREMREKPKEEEGRTLATEPFVSTRSVADVSSILVTSPAAVAAAAAEPESELVRAYKAQKVVTIAEAVKKARFIMGSKRFTVQGILVKVLQNLRIVEQMWTIQLRICDTSSQTIDCYVDNDTLATMIGWTAEEATKVNKSTDKQLKQDGARRLHVVSQQLHRLDLLMEVEFFSGGLATPIIRKVTAISQLCESSQ